jgi:homoaconitase/3-isopropylmalate dehydratase large subunit
VAVLLGGELTPGKEIALRVHQMLLQDATGTMASPQSEELGMERVAVPLAVQYVDHNMIQIDFKNPDNHRYLQAFTAKYGIHYAPHVAQRVLVNHTHSSRAEGNVNLDIMMWITGMKDAA